MVYNFAIIGTGMIAEYHAKALELTESANLVACFNDDYERAVNFAEKFECIAYEKLEDLLADTSVKVINICTPTGYHLEPALRSMAAGKNVLIVKPLETTVDRCRQLIEAAETYEVSLGVIYPFRYHHNLKELKRLIEIGAMGKLYQGDAYVKWYRTQEYYDSGNWRGTWKVDGGGALMNQSIHAIDLIQWMLGDINEICGFTATLGHRNIEVEDNAVAILRYSSGALGVIQGSTVIYPGYEIKIEISGENGTVCLHGDKVAYSDLKESVIELANFEENTFRQDAGGSGDPADIDFLDHTSLFSHFIRHHQETGEWPIDGYEAMKSVETISRIYQSNQNIQVIQEEL